MEKFIELLQQIQELAGVAIEALQGGGGAEGASPAEGAPPSESPAPPPPGS